MQAAQDDPGAEAITAHLARRSARAAGGAIEIAPDEVEAFTLFMAMGTQWRKMVIPMTAIMMFEGMIYEALGPTAAMLEIKMTPALFADMRLMEGAAMGELNR